MCFRCESAKLQLLARVLEPDSRHSGSAGVRCSRATGHCTARPFSDRHGERELGGDPNVIDSLDHVNVVTRILSLMAEFHHR